MTTTPKKPSAAQRRVLEAIAAGLPANSHCRSMSDYGGLRGTLASLHRLGWLEDDNKITEAGREAIAGAAKPPAQQPTTPKKAVAVAITHECHATADGTRQVQAPDWLTWDHVRDSLALFLWGNSRRVGESHDFEYWKRYIDQELCAGNEMNPLKAVRSMLPKISDEG